MTREAHTRGVAACSLSMKGVSTEGRDAPFLMAAASWLAGLANGGTPEAFRHQEEVEYDVVNLPHARWNN